MRWRLHNREARRAEKRARLEQLKRKHQADVERWAREQAMQFAAELYADLENSEAGRAALDLGAGIGSHRLPCPTHGETNCQECEPLIRRYMTLHRYGAALDTITCMFTWDDDAEPCSADNYQHLCGRAGHGDLREHAGLHVCGWCGAEDDGSYAEESEDTEDE